MTTGTEKIEVTARSNDGYDSAKAASDMADAMKVAKGLRTPGNHMVCIVQDGVRTLRWDRSRVVGENRWRKVNPDDFEVLGQIRSVRVIRTVAPETDLLGDEIQQTALRCFQVGDCDWFAATSPEQALELMRELVGYDDEYSVVLASEDTLDCRWREADESDVDAGSLREWLAAATEPGWLAGTAE
ncbi:MAG: hypothetical protein RSD49_01425 [Hafnia sp.]